MTLRTLLFTSLALLAPRSPAAPPPSPAPAVVSHVKVLSDKVQDVSSLAAWKQSFINDSMSDREKALAVWESVFRFRHQDLPPDEFLENEGHPHDPIKDFNVYGYGQCCCASANVIALSRYIGLEARGWAIVGHSVPEVKWAGAWHMLDASLIAYFPKPDGQPAAVDEILRGIDLWYQSHPALRHNEPALRKMMTASGWKQGPPVLALCPTYDPNGWLPAATHGWYSTMSEYADAKKSFPYEYGTAVGYEVNLQLHPGQRLTRNWSNKGLEINARPDFDLLHAAVGQGDLRYSPAHGDLAPGRIGNGLLEWTLPLASPDLADAALEYSALAPTPDGLRPADPARPGQLVLRVTSPYVFLTGQVDLTLAPGASGSLTLLLSDNNGLDWKPLATLTTPGPHTLDLKPLVRRKYDYRLKLVLAGPDTRLTALRLSHDIQHSQRALPALAAGDNTITFDAGAQEGTITLQGSTNPDFKDKNLALADFHPTLHHIAAAPAFLTGPKGDLTLPVETPGDLRRLRVAAHYRARGPKDRFDVRASFDDGRTWSPVGVLDGPTPGNSKSFTLADVPPNSRHALVQLAGSQQNTLGFFDLRIDADYTEPHGGFAPIKITYVWDEAGKEHRDTHLATSPHQSYTLHCPTTPTMKSIIIERD